MLFITVSHFIMVPDMRVFLETTPTICNVLKAQNYAK